MIDSNKERIQQEAVQQCLNSRDAFGKFRGTCEIATGTGKTFISFWLIHHLNPKTVLFLAETTIREQNIINDIKFFKECYGIDLFENRSIEFACYQSAYKWNNKSFDMVIADEIHDSLSLEYIKFYKNNHYVHLLGLSATIDRKSKYEDGDGKEYTKIDMLNSIAPIVFKYTISDGIINNTTRNLNIIVIKHKLNNVDKTMVVKYREKTTGQPKSFYQTEQQMYDYYNNKFYGVIFSKNREDYLIRMFAKKRSEVLYKAPSKLIIIQELLKYLDRTIIFGNDIDSITSIVPTVSSKNKPAINNSIINNFNNGIIGVIGSFKMLKQGINLKNLDNVILHSYYGIEKDIIQRIGRLRQSNKPGFVFIILTENTQEQVWFNRMIESLNLNILWCDTVTDAINLWKNILIQHTKN